MLIELNTDGKKLEVDLRKPFDISIPLRFNERQPNVYDVGPAVSKPCEYGEFIGDTRLGGSVNFEEYTFIPHCNGTHTECVGHITDERLAIRDCLKDVFVESVLISVETENALSSPDTYPYDLEDGDEFITQKAIEKALSDAPMDTACALVVRTLPNGVSKLRQSYDKPVPPFFSNEAMKLLIDYKIDHLIVDLPSIDRLYDNGKLSNHRIFWSVEAGSRTITTETRINSTVTELVYIPDEINEGRYLLNLQIAPFGTDAAPSRPILFEIIGV